MQIVKYDIEAATYTPKGELSKCMFNGNDVEEIIYKRKSIWKINNCEYPNIWIDLGLPSGTKWGSCNLGATDESDHGLYYQWGDTTGYSDGSHSTWSTYWDNPSGDGTTFTKYNTASAYLETSDDACYIATNGVGHTPTPIQFKELYDNTTMTLTRINDVLCDKFTGPNGNYILMPAAGDYYNGNISSVGRSGYYWSNLISSYAGMAYYMLFYESYVYPKYDAIRCIGRNLRPVRDK